MLSMVVLRAGHVYRKVPSLGQFKFLMGLILDNMGLYFGYGPQFDCSLSGQRILIQIEAYVILLSTLWYTE
jgi:hypothetical protein